MSDREKQEFNFAVSDLGRINLICASIEDAMMSLDAYSWLNALQTLSATLSPYMKEEEIEKFNNDFDSALTQVNNTISNEKRTGRKEIPRDTYSLLKKIYINLRRIQKESDLLGSQKTDFLEAENW